MIETVSVRNLRSNDYDVVYAIVRSPGKLRGSANIQIVKELSPDWNLFKLYLGLRDEGKWGKEAFEALYKPRFLDQIANDRAAQTRLREIADLDKAGKRVALVCFCTDPSTCHRSLVAGLLKSMGCDVTVH